MNRLLYFPLIIVLLACGQNNRQSVLSNKATADTAVITHQFVPRSERLKGKIDPPPPRSEEEKSFFLNEYTSEEQKHFFPFNQAVKIQLVSFDSDGCLVIIEAPQKGGKYKPNQEVKQFCGLPNEKGRVI